MKLRNCITIQQVGREHCNNDNFFVVSIFTVFSLAGSELNGSQINVHNGNSSSNAVKCQFPRQVFSLGTAQSFRERPQVLEKMFNIVLSSLSAWQSGLGRQQLVSLPRLLFFPMLPGGELLGGRKKLNQSLSSAPKMRGSLK